MNHAAALALGVMRLLDDPAENEIPAARIIVDELLPQKIVEFGEEQGFGKSLDYVRARDAHQRLIEILKDASELIGHEAFYEELDKAKLETQKLVNALAFRWTDCTVEEW